MPTDDEKLDALLGVKRKPSLLQEIMAEREAAAAAPEPRVSPTAPQPVPQVQAAKNDFVQQRARVGIQEPGADYDAEVLAAMKQVADPPAVPRNPSLSERAVLAIGPRTARRDGRRVTDPVEQGQAIAGAAPQQLLDVALAPVGMPHRAVQLGRARAGMSRDDAAGLVVESPVMQLLRVFGTAVPAAVQEAAMATPAFLDPTDITAGPKTMNDMLGGEEARGFEAPLNSTSEFKNALARVFDKVEHGAGLDRDWGSLARRGASAPGSIASPDTAETVGWSLGMLADMATNWEAAPASAMGKLSKALKMADVAKAGGVEGRIRTAWEAVRLAFSDELKEADHMADKVMDAVRTTRDLDVLPKPVRLRAEHVARQQYGVDLADLAAAGGYVAPKSTPTPTPTPTADRGAIRFAHTPGEALRMLDELGLRDEPHGGWEAMRTNADFRVGEWKAGNPYTLRNSDGDILFQGSLEETVSRMAVARRTGDNITDAYMNDRPVALWRRAGRGDDAVGTIDVDTLFSSPLEAEAIAKAKVSAPWSQLKKRQKQHARASEARAERVMGMTLGTQDIPATQDLGLDGDLQTVVAEATRQLFRERAGADNLVSLGAARVLPQEAARIRGEVRDVFSSAGLPLDLAKGVDVGARGVPVTPEQAAAAERLAKAYNVELTDTRLGLLGLRDWNNLQGAVMKAAGGLAVRQRHLFQRAPGFAESLARAADQLVGAGSSRKPWKDALDGQPVGSAQRLLQRLQGAAGSAVSRVKDPTRAAPPPSVQRVLRNLETSLESNAQDLAREVGDMTRSMSRADIAAALFPRTNPVPLGAADVADRLSLSQANDITTDVLRRIAAVDPSADWARAADLSDIGKRAELVVKAKAWAKTQQSDRLRFVREWVMSIPRSLDGARRSRVIRALASDRDAVADIHREVVGAGNLESPRARAFLREHVGRTQLHTPTTALIGLLLRRRESRLMDKAVSRLIEEGLGVPAPIGSPKVDRYTGLLDGTVAPESMSPGDYAEAVHQLELWGLRPGDGANFDELGLGDKVVTIPSYWMERLRRAGTGGRYESYRLGSEDADAGLGAYLLSTWKQSVLTGIGPLLNPGHFLGQVAGMPFTVWTTLGAKAGTRVAKTTLEEFPLIGSLAARGAELPWARAQGQAKASVLTTDDGRLYHIDELEDIAARNGLFETATRFDTSAGVSEVLEKADGSPFAQELQSGLQQVVPRRLWGLIDAPMAERFGKNWQAGARDVASAADQVARLGTLVDGLKRGLSPDEAAARARDALLDYGALTDFERSTMRSLFTFYTFMRQNTGTHLDTALRHPERLAQQARFAHGIMQPWGLSDIEQLAVDDSTSSRVTVMQRNTDDPRHRSVAFQTTPVGPAEVIELYKALPLIGENEYLDQMTPPAQALAMLASRTTPGGWRIDNLKMNRVPESLMEIPGLNYTLRRSLGVGPMVLEPEDQHLQVDSATAAANGEPAVWVVGGETMRNSSAPAWALEAIWKSQVMSWQLIRMAAGRPIGRVQDFTEAAGMSTPEDGLTQADEIIEAATGLRAKPINTEDEAVREAQGERQARLQYITSIMKRLGGK